MGHFDDPKIAHILIRNHM